MFLKSLVIKDENKIIRQINFHKGINLIVDKTPQGDTKETGNNVGKTTILKLIDFCLAGDPKEIYTDPETKKDVYQLVKNYLIKNKIIISLVLKRDLDDVASDEIEIERNFLSYKEKIQSVNGHNFNNEEFIEQLSRLIIPELITNKPTFRQVISHNIRYKDENINNTLKTLDKYTTDAEYEALYLFLFGCYFDKGDLKQEILERQKQEVNFKTRLEKHQSKSAYEAALAIIESDIFKLNKKKESLNINKNFETDLNELTSVKYNISKCASEINQYTTRKDLIMEAETSLNLKKTDIDLNQLKLIYQQATDRIDGIQKTFEDLVNFHNQMIEERIRFVIKELPEIEQKLRLSKISLKEYLAEEERLTSSIAKSDAFEDLEELIIELNGLYQKKGEYDKTISQLNEVEKNIKHYSSQLYKMEEELFSDEFSEKVRTQIYKFNEYFADISNQLYGEKYLVNPEIDETKNGRLYKFSAFNTNLSSGKKQGEISCFDIAYTLFADSEGISCLHFLLNDKKELVHDNQLVKIAEFVNRSNMQFVASILKDKLPEELNNKEYFIVELSQSDKLFRIESDN